MVALLDILVILKNIIYIKSTALNTEIVPGFRTKPKKDYSFSDKCWTKINAKSHLLILTWCLLGFFLSPWTNESWIVFCTDKQRGREEWRAFASCLHEPLAQLPKVGLNFLGYQKDVITSFQHPSHPAVVEERCHCYHFLWLLTKTIISGIVEETQFYWCLANTTKENM